MCNLLLLCLPPFLDVVAVVSLVVVQLIKCPAKLRTTAERSLDIAFVTSSLSQRVALAVAAHTPHTHLNRNRIEIAVLLSRQPPRFERGFNYPKAKPQNEQLLLDNA